MGPADGPDKLKEPMSSSGVRRRDVGAAGGSEMGTFPGKLILFTDEVAMVGCLCICPAKVIVKIIFPETGRLFGAMAKSSEIMPVSWIHESVASCREEPADLDDS